MTDREDDERLDAEITELQLGEVSDREAAGVLPGDGENRSHVAEDLSAGQGGDDRDGLPAEDLMQLAGIRAAGDQSAIASSDEVDRLGTITDTAIYQGDLEARPMGGDQPDEDDAQNLDILLETELRAGETADAGEAAEEGLTWVPPTDPPVVAGEDGQPEIAAGFGATADEEPFDADHHSSALSGEDERTERIREALMAHAATVGFVDRLRFDTIGSRVVLEGTVDDLDDEDAVVGVISDVVGVTEVVNRLEVTTVE